MPKTLKQKLGSSLIKKVPFSREMFDAIRFELNAMRINTNNKLNPFARRRIKNATQGKNLSVNIAAGPFGQKKWVNIDMFQHENISFRFDCRKKLPFQDATVKRIRAEHVLEHLCIRDEAPFFLRQCFRILEQGGVLRIVVPDVEKYMKAYVSKDNEVWKTLGWDLTNLPKDMPTDIYLINHVVRQDGEHKFGYDFASLQDIVLKAGFKKVIRQEWSQSIDSELTNDLENHRLYSLYVDCIK